MTASRVLLGCFTAVLAAAVLAPLLVTIVISFSPRTTFLLPDPAHGLSLRWWRALTESEEFQSAFTRSVILAACAATLALTIGGLASYAAVRYVFPGRRLLGTAVLMPIVMPDVVTALALLQFLAGFRLNGSFIGLLGAHVVICLPYTFRVLSVGFNAVDANLERAARNLGAPGWRVAALVTLPLMVPSILGAATFAFLISFDAFTVSLVLSGDTFVTLPVQTFTYIVDINEPLVAAVQTAMIIISVTLVLVFQRLVGLTRAVEAQS